MRTSTTTGLPKRLEAIRRRHAPDPRLAVWEIEASDEGAPRVRGWTTAEGAMGEIRAAAAEAGAEADVRLLPDPSLGADVVGLPHRSVAHLRREPRHGSELVSQILLGEEVVCLREDGEWIQVQCGDGYVGWVHRGSLVRRAAPEGPAAVRARLLARRPEPGTWIVTARAPVLRAAPGGQAAIACDLVRGARVRATAEAAGLRVTLPDGLEGWLPADAAVPWERLAERFPQGGAAILEHAVEHLGLPYLWGGTSEKGFDCSGLVQRIYGLHGVPLPRDSDQQSAAGTPVEPGADWSGARDGDLAFFHDEPGGRATHVGVVARGGRLLHASTTRNSVAWDALREGDSDRSEFRARLASRLSGVRRVLP